MKTLHPVEKLRQHIEREAKAAGVPWDTYHADFLLGVLYQWLDEFDAVITGTGIIHLSEWRDADA